MLEDKRKRTMEDLIPQILNLLAKKQNDQLDSKTISRELKTETEEVNHCLEEMKYLKLVDVTTHFGPRYSAQITPIGLANLAENIDSTEKKDG